MSRARNKRHPRMSDEAAHVALRAPQPREAYILQKPHSWELPKGTCPKEFHLNFLMSAGNSLELYYKFIRSGPGKPNQRKVSSRTFRGGIPEQKFNVNRASFPKEKHQNSQKWAKFMNFSVLALSLVWFAAATS